MLKGNIYFKRRGNFKLIKNHTLDLKLYSFIKK